MSIRQTAILSPYKKEFAQRAPVYAGTIPLSMTTAGTQVRICSIKGKDETRRFLNSLGFVENAQVTVLTELAGNVIVLVRDTRVAISKAMAMRILTE